MFDLGDAKNRPLRHLTVKITLSFWEIIARKFSILSWNNELSTSLLQLIDFRFAKQMSDERTFTICGMADFLAPEMILGQGHGLASDWCFLSSFPLVFFKTKMSKSRNMDTLEVVLAVQLHTPWKLVSRYFTLFIWICGHYVILYVLKSFLNI